MELAGEPLGDHAGPTQEQGDLPLQPGEGLLRVGGWLVRPLGPGHRSARGRQTTSAELGARSGTRSRR